MPNYAKPASGHRARVLTAELSSNVNNFAPVQLGPPDSNGNERIIGTWSTANHLRLSTDGSGPYNVTGFAAVTGDDGQRGIVNGTEITITLMGPDAISFPNNDPASLEGNRNRNDGSFTNLLADTTFTIWYDQNSGVWRYPQKVV